MERGVSSGIWFFCALIRTHPQVVTDFTNALETRTPAS